MHTIHIYSDRLDSLKKIQHLYTQCVLMLKWQKRIQFLHRDDLPLPKVGRVGFNKDEHRVDKKI